MDPTPDSGLSVYAAIKAKLAAANEIDVRYDYTNASDAMEQLRQALLAVLDLHATPDSALPGETHRGELMDWMQGGCPTVRTIAKALGIEARDV